MNLRVKLGAVLFAVLLASTVALAWVEAHRTLRLMVDSLSASGRLVIDQTFELMRTSLGQARGDLLDALRGDREVRAFLQSSQALGQGVLYVRIEKPGGAAVAGTNGGVSSGREPRPFALLERELGALSPFAVVRALSSNRIYEMSREVQVNDRPFVTIKVGLSTVLIASRVRRELVQIARVAGGALAASLVVSIVFVGFVLRPVAAITLGVERLSTGEDAVALRVKTHDELGALAEKFNQLSQRIRSDRTRWESERGQFLNVFRSITDGVVLLDSGGTVLFANAEAQGRLGLPAGGLAEGKSLRTLLGAEHPVLRLVDAVWGAGSEVHDVPVEIGRQGSAGRLLVSVSALGQGANPPGLLIVLRDLEPVQELGRALD